MISLEDTVNQILSEEGQVVLSLNDLDITWEQLERVFKGTYEQCKGYITVYDWLTDTISIEGKKEPDWANVRHMTYNAYNNMQRFMPDVPGNYWEFNPYTKKMSSLMASNFSFEVAKYPTIQKVDWEIKLQNVEGGQTVKFDIPYSLGTIKIYNGEEEIPVEVTEEEIDLEDQPEDTYLAKYPFRPKSETGDILNIESDDVNGTINNYDLTGELLFNYGYDEIIIKATSKFVSIIELDLTCELFYNWYKANLLTMIGAIKKQIDLEGVGLPFNFNADELLARGREIMTKVEELKGTKSHWSNF